MTLILSVLTPSYAIQVADRQLSWDGHATVAPAEKEANKAAIYVCNDARLIVGFTGLAKYGHFETSWWLLDRLLELAAPEYSAEGTTDRLADALTTKFRTLRLPLSQKRLAVVITGFLWDGRPAYCLVSNFNGDDAEGPAQATALPQFAVCRYAFGGGSLISWVGREDLVPSSDMRILMRLASDGQAAPVLLRHTVATLQRAARLPRALGQVSEDCTSVTLDPATGALDSAFFRGSGGSSRLHGPSIVRACSTGQNGAIAHPVSDVPYTIQLPASPQLGAGLASYSRASTK